MAEETPQGEQAAGKDTGPEGLGGDELAVDLAEVAQGTQDADGQEPFTPEGLEETAPPAPPADQGEQKAEPESKAGQEPDKAEGEAEMPPEKVWDKERQRRDEELAELRKKTAELEAQVAAGSVKAKEGQVADDAEVGVVDEVPAFDEPLEEIPDITDDAGGDEYRAFAAATKKRQGQLERRLTALTDTLQRGADKRSGNAVIERAVKLVGEENRNELVLAIQAEAKKRGYRDGRYPPSEQTEDLAMRLAYEIRAKHANDAKPPAKARTPAPKSDTAARGVPAPKSRPYAGSIDAEYAEMIRHGEVKVR